MHVRYVHVVRSEFEVRVEFKVAKRREWAGGHGRKGELMVECVRCHETGSIGSFVSEVERVTIPTGSPPQRRPSLRASVRVQLASEANASAFSHRAIARPARSWGYNEGPLSMNRSP